jgi:hypothetical protein
MVLHSLLRVNARPLQRLLGQLGHHHTRNIRHLVLNVRCFARLA